MPGEKKFDLGDYVEVKERIRVFYDLFGQGRLVTGEVRLSNEPDGKPRVLVQGLAYRTPDDPLPGVGWSWMELPGTTSYTRGSELENTETSAWGRAIASLGILVDRSIASAQEVANKEGAEKRDGGQLDRMEPTDGSLIGTVTKGKPPVDLELRQTSEGPIAGFKLVEGRSGLQVLAQGDLASALHPFLAGLVDQRVSVWGTIEMVAWDKGAQPMPPFRRLMLSKIRTPDWELPAPDGAVTVRTEAATEALPFTDDEQAAILAREMAEADA